MDDQTATLQSVVVLALVAVGLAFVIFVQDGGLLRLAIGRAIADGRVILGMTKEDVISSWGRSYHAKEPSIQRMGVDTELVALTWTYEDPHCTVHFNSDGIVIWITGCSED
jgi:hypothetical protein